MATERNYTRSLSLDETRLAQFEIIVMWWKTMAHRRIILDLTYLGIFFFFFGLRIGSNCHVFFRGIPIGRSVWMFWVSQHSLVLKVARDFNVPEKQQHFIWNLIYRIYFEILAIGAHCSKLLIGMMSIWRWLFWQSSKTLVILCRLFLEFSLNFDLNFAGCNRPYDPNARKMNSFHQNLLHSKIHEEVALAWIHQQAQIKISR